MKKSVVLLVLVCLGAFKVLATGSINWQVTSATLKNLNGSLNAGGATLDLIMVDNTTDLNSLITGLGNNTYNSGTLSSATGVLLLDGTTANAGGGTSSPSARTVTTGSLNRGTAYNFYIVSFDTFGSGTTYFQVSAAVNQTAYTTPPDAGPLALYGAAQFGANSNTAGVPGSQNGWVAPIPEPCTMALFGLGAAVIGLRRRFTKKS